LDWFNSLRLPPLKNEWLASSSNEGCIPVSLKKMKFKTYKGNINA